VAVAVSVRVAACKRASVSVEQKRFREVGKSSKAPDGTVTNLGIEAWHLTYYCRPDFGANLQRADCIICYDYASRVLLV
jgi:hypothetical protein